MPGVYRAWAQEQKRICRDHLRAGRFDQARIILQDLSDHDWLFGDAQLLTEYQAGLVNLWEKAGATEQAGFEHLLEAASVTASLYYNSPIAVALYKSSLTGPRLLQLANVQANGSDRFSALPFHQAANQRLSSSRNPWRSNGPELSFQEREQEKWNIQQKLSASFLDLANQLAQGDKPVITTYQAEDVLRQGAEQLQNQPLQVPLWRKLARLQESELARISEPALSCSLDRLASSERVAGEEYNTLNQAIRESDSLAGAILHQTGARLWASLVMDTNFNPWPLLPSELREEFAQRRNKNEKEDYLRQSLGSRGQHRAFQIPLDEFNATRQLRCEIRARRGLFVYAVQPEECVDWLRQALWENTDDQLRRAVEGAVTTAIFNCRQPSRFPAFYVLTGFFVSEIGLDKIPPENLAASGLPGFSVLSIDNSTEHHLLIFYRGPESFFIASRPFKKTSAVLRDGKYEIGVITPSGAIQPYRGEVTLQASWQKSNYRLEQSNSRQDQFVGSHGSSAGGEYRLVRQPPATGPFQVNPGTGAVSRQ